MASLEYEPQNLDSIIEARYQQARRGTQPVIEGRQRSVLVAQRDWGRFENRQGLLKGDEEEVLSITLGRLLKDLGVDFSNERCTKLYQAIDPFHWCNFATGHLYETKYPHVVVYRRVEVDIHNFELAKEVTRVVNTLPWIVIALNQLRTGAQRLRYPQV